VTGCVTANSEKVVTVQKPYLICIDLREIPKAEQNELLTEYEELSARGDKPATAMLNAFEDYANMREKARKCQEEKAKLEKDNLK
jgi:hypothetical protein